MRALLALLLLWPFALFAVDRTLSDCTVGGTPTALAPLDLDNCTINDGDDITGILTGLAGTYGDVYVKAPSQSIGVTFTGTVEFGPSGEGADEFKFFEDEFFRFDITHVPVTEDATMWRMTNLDALTIGGVGLRLTFHGTHPGLGQGKPCSGGLESCTVLDNPGLISIQTTDNSNPALLDIRANFWKTWAQGIWVGGGQPGDLESGVNRWQQANFAGLHVGAGIYVNGGVMDVWVDPDRTMMMDPWHRPTGWDGAVAGTSGGISFGCMDNARAQYRNDAGLGLQFTRNVTGGVTLSYGTPNSSMFVPKYIGTAEAPFLVRIENWGASGPSAITGLTAGVRIRSGYADGINKFDPAFDYGITSPFRFFRYHILPSTYGNGTWHYGIASGCAEGNATSNASGVSGPWIFRAEASRDGTSSQYVSYGFDVTFQNAELWQPPTDAGSGSPSPYTADTGGAGQDASPGTSTPDRTYGHVIRAASGSKVWRIRLLDTNTATGPGEFDLIELSRAQIDAGSDDYLNPVDNTITDTRISGKIDAQIDSIGTVVDNVEFTGSARLIITLGVNAEIALSNLCVPNGSTMTRADTSATATLDGSPVTFTANSYTFSALSACSITEDSLPGPVTGGSVN